MLMLLGEIISVKSENHTNHINKFCGQNGAILNMKASDRLHTVTTALERVNLCTLTC
jgi:hypothetical protein